MQQGGVLDDQRVRLLNRFAQADFLVVQAAERDHRRAHAFRPETRKGLGVLALDEGRDRHQLGGGDNALPASAVNSYLEHQIAPSLFKLYRAT